MVIWRLKSSAVARLQRWESKAKSEIERQRRKGFLFESWSVMMSVDDMARERNGYQISSRALHNRLTSGSVWRGSQPLSKEMFLRSLRKENFVKTTSIVSVTMRGKLSSLTFLDDSRWSFFYSFHYLFSSLIGWKNKCLIQHCRQERIWD